MKTNYPLRSRTRRGHTRRNIIITLLVLFIGAGVFTLFGGALRGVVAPLWQGQNILTRGAHNLLGWFYTKDHLIRENEALREMLVSRDVELISLRSVKESEGRLLSMLGRTSPYKVVLATVLVRPPETPYDILVIDAGERDGVRVGDEVVLPEGPSLGTVSDVSGSTSEVRLYTSSGVETSAILERHEIPVTLTGQGGGNFRITMPRDVEVEEGDRILSVGLPSELLAVVGKINMTPTDSFKEVLARGASNIFTLRYIIVQR